MPTKSLAITVFAILTVAVGLGLFRFGPAKNLDDLIADANIRYFASATKVSDEIVIIFLDEITMKGLPYRSPVPRDFLAELNEKILAASPRVVGYDIFFKDPTLATSDERLVTSFKKGNVYAVSAGKTDESGKDYEDMPMDLFANSLTGIGLADLPFSASDAVVRYAQFEFDIEGKTRPSFVTALYNTKIPPYPPFFPPKADPPLEEKGKEGGLGHNKTRIRFAGPPSKIGREGNLFKIFPAHLVAKGLIPAEWLKDKLVLVGAAYDDGTDAYITPYYSSHYNYERMPGVEIHANILNQLLTRQFYYELPQYLLIAGLIFAGFISALLFLYGPIWRSVSGTALLTLVFAVKIVLCFHWWNFIIPFVPFEGSMFVTLGACLGWRSVTEGRQKRFIKGVFAKYVPPSVVDKMIANPKLLTLGGEQREITCLFTDIASFTTISEKLDPKTLVSFLNEYLDKLTRIIFKYGGTLDKYEGDAIIAFFGAPVDVDNHREAALLAAIEMQKASREISDKWKGLCGREIVTRIGLNSGQAVVGNMGSNLRFDYTAIGDTMNLSSRLEGANKFFGTQILASASTATPLLCKEISTPSLSSPYKGEDIISRFVARLKVKGKTEAVRVYEIAGMRSDFTEDEIKNILARPEIGEIVELDAK